MNITHSGKKEHIITQEKFDRLLAWLGSDREQAGKKYEEIRSGLIKIFVCWGCNDAEDLTDETINRVIGKLPEIAPTYVGNPALYFSSTARFIHLEYERKKAQLFLLNSDMAKQVKQEEVENMDPEYECLDRCIERLSPANRELVLEYYKEEKQAMVENRKKLAEKIGIKLNALRVRADRIRASLEICVADCLKQKGKKRGL
jgi:RNA polymerase sigma factor (sigma-70 family)